MKIQDLDIDVACLIPPFKLNCLRPGTCRSNHYSSEYIMLWSAGLPVYPALYNSFIFIIKLSILTYLAHCRGSMLNSL